MFGARVFPLFLIINIIIMQLGLAMCPFYPTKHSLLLHLSITNYVLDLGVHLNHFSPQLRMLIPQDLRVPAGCHKDCVNTTGQRSSEDVGNLETNKEGKSENDGCETTILVVRRIGESEVEVGEKSASVRNKGGSKGENGTNKTFLS